jgi:predicted DNA-binding protein (MmcQ/YjbR family)
MRGAGEAARRSSRPVVQRLRSLCLSLPETTETSSWGHPNFRAGKKTFAAFEIVKGRPSIAFRLDPADVERLLRRRPFFMTPYGRGSWVSFWVDGRVSWKLVADLVHRSYQTVALKRLVSRADALSGTRRAAARR